MGLEMFGASRARSGEQAEVAALVGRLVDELARSEASANVAMSALVSAMIRVDRQLRLAGVCREGLLASRLREIADSLDSGAIDAVAESAGSA